MTASSLQCALLLNKRLFHTKATAVSNVDAVAILEIHAYAILEIHANADAILEIHANANADAITDVVAMLDCVFAGRVLPSAVCAFPHGIGLRPGTFVE